MNDESVLDRFRLDGRVALVTGASRGIGRASALALAQAGASVVLCSRTAEDLHIVASEIADDSGASALVHPADVGDLDQLGPLVDAALEHFGRLDVVVNNAGGWPPRPFLDTSARFLEHAFHFNVTTAHELTRLTLPHLLESRGAVINISSAIGRLVDRGMVAYGTAKAALSHWTRLTAAECAPKVRVNAIAVGATETSALETVLDDNLRALMVAGTPMRRLGQPSDIAAGVLFLASDAGSYITGKVVEIDGGIETPNLATGLPDL